MTWYVALGLFLCLFWTLAGPLLSRRVEERLEWFVLGLGVAAVTISWSWSETAVIEAFLRPMKLCGALLVGALVFSFSHDAIRRGIRRAMDRLGLPLAVGLAVALCGFAAGLFTMAVAVFALVEILHALRLERESEVHAAVLGCFAIGIGGALSPIGGPASAIAMSKLAGGPYEVGPGYLLGLLGPWAVPAVLGLGAAAGLLSARPAPDRDAPLPEDPLSLWSILVMTGRLYVFTAGLVLLGAGLVPFIDSFLIAAPPGLLFWANSVSALVDNASLAAIEISPRMSQNQLRYILLSIAVVDGALVTANAPNLVAAHKLKIAARDWARAGLPAAAVLMVVYFLSLAAHAGLAR